jgi:SAM-dependent methyltransferase
MAKSNFKNIIEKIARRMLSYSLQDSVVTVPNSLVDPFEIGRQDAVLSGWFDESNGRLFKNFVIEDTDIVLDVGSGNGGVAHFCGQFSNNVIITDIDIGNAKNAFDTLKTTNCKIKTAIVSDSMPLPIADNTIDKVISMEVIEHVEDPKAFLKELYRVGASGARYLISAPAGISEQLQKPIAAKEHFLSPNHIQIFNDDELLELIKDQGFIIESNHIDGFYWTIWWLMFWCDGQPLSPPWSHLLQSWPMLWSALMATENSEILRETLNNALPKTQIFIARKP